MPEHEESSPKVYHTVIKLEKMSQEDLWKELEAVLKEEVHVADKTMAEEEPVGSEVGQRVNLSGGTAAEDTASDTTAIQASLSNLLDSFTQTEPLYMCTTDPLRTNDEKPKCEKVNLEESKPPAEEETPESHHPLKESSIRDQTSELQDVEKHDIDALGNASLTVKYSEDPLSDDAAVPESQLAEGPRYNFETVQDRLKRLCKEVGVKNATIAIANRLSKCTVIGENTSSLNSKIKEDEYLRHFKITVKERQGRKHSHLLSIITLFRKAGLLVKCELFLKDSITNDYYAFLPAHSFLDVKHFDIEENLNWFQGLEYEITFQYPSKQHNVTSVPKFLFCRDNKSSFRTVMDIAAVKVDQSMVLDDRGEPFCKPMILKVNENALKHLIDECVPVFLKNDEAGYIMHLNDDSNCYKGLLWVEFQYQIFEKGDCGTVIYVKDIKNNKYMLSTLREGYDEEPWYGTTVLSYNLRALQRLMKVENLRGLNGECIFVECTQEFLNSLVRGHPMDIP